jgi:hypothetical protein
MKEQNPSETKGRKRNLSGTLRLVGVEAGAETPDMAVFALDRVHQPVYQSPVDTEGRFEIPGDVLEKSTYIAISSETDLQRFDAEQAMVYRTRRFRELIKDNPLIEIPRRDWSKWLFVTRCVSGSVRHCYPWPWWVSDVLQQAVYFKASQAKYLQVSPTKKSALQDIALAKNAAILPFFHRCEIVCDGIVEVYRRTCCCFPWFDLEPRLPEIIDRLEDLIRRIPIKWPPFPEPDPPPFLELPIFRGGLLDEMAINAPQDLVMLKSLLAPQKVEYIQARPYLLHFFCNCGPAVKVAQGTIRSDGGFSICWKEPVRLMLINCHDEYAYVVKQNIGGATVTIYDGIAANKWFHYDDEANLVSYHPLAQGCRHNDFPGEGAFALLQDIGLTESYRLKTPDAAGWDRVAAPGYNDGLADPVANPADALGKYKNRNWGGSLYLRYAFSEPMKSVGAKFFRISISAANVLGNPVGDRTYLSAGLSWRKYVVSGTDILVETENLGPFSAGGENNLFVIPYDADADWQSGQYHGILTTSDYPNGRYLLTLEVFDAAGNRLRPNGAGGPGIDADFTYRRWYQPIGPTAEVPFAALTHILWWDNRKAIADIIDLRQNGNPSAEECQFMEGPDSDTFSVGYKAYHPEPMFLLNHSLWWRRGLGGPTGYLVNSDPNNIGPLPGVSPVASFASMLGSEQKCSFALNLYVNVKTTNGFGTLDNLDAWDYAAFALEISP